MQTDTIFFYLTRRERDHQIGLGFTAEHDDTHGGGEIAAGASCYFMAAALQCARPTLLIGEVADRASRNWAFDSKFKPELHPAKNIIKGLAMGIAELQRLDRAGEIEGLDDVEVKDYLELLDRLVQRVRAAKEKYPHEGNMLFPALAAEQGELAEALMNESPERVTDEALDVAAVAMRIAESGDGTLDAERTRRGLAVWPA